MKKKRRRKNLIRIRNAIAREHINVFFSSLTYLLSKNVSSKWILREGKLIRNFVKWFGLRWDKKIKYFFCPKCKNIMLQNIKVRVRNNRFKHIVIKCPSCGAYKRIRLSKK